MSCSGYDDGELEVALAELPAGLDAFAIATHLRKRLGAERGRIAAELHELRTRALRRFPSGALRFLTRKALEQATPERVAAARAADFAARATHGTVLDATCGLGADSLGLAATDVDLVSADRDPELAWRARANLRARGHAGHVIVADATHPALDADWLLIDPDRRDEGGRRSMSPAEWSPTLAECLHLAARCRGAAIKLPPAYDPSRHPELHDGATPSAFEWTSLDGSLVETVLWLGELAEDRPRASAHMLRGTHGNERVGGARESIDPLDGAAAREVGWIADPDPALIRAGQLERVAREAGLRPLARELGYLGGHAAPAAPGLAYHRVLDSAPLDHKRVRAMLVAHGIGPLTVKQRGHRDSAETLAARHSRKTGRRGTLIVARLDSGHRAYLVEPLPRGGVVGDEGFEPPTSSL